MSSIIAQTKKSDTELIACKAVLLAIFVAPSQGVCSSRGGEGGWWRTQAKVSKAEPRTKRNITETTGWNDDLEKLWYDTVSNAQSSAEPHGGLCMFGVLLAPQVDFGIWDKLLNALPPSHYAVRAPTLSAVAMRVYCLDKVLIRQS